MILRQIFFSSVLEFNNSVIETRKLFIPYLFLILNLDPSVEALTLCQILTSMSQNFLVGFDDFEVNLHALASDLHPLP